MYFFSRYFQIWTVLWVGGFVAIFIGVVYLGARSEVAKREPTWRVWIENANEIQYPEFRFEMLADSANSFQITTCSTADEKTIDFGPCDGGRPISKCVESVNAGQRYASPTSNKLSCLLEWTGPKQNISNDNLMLFRVVGNVQKPSLQAYISASDNVMLVLNKQVNTDKQMQRNVDYNINVIYATSVQDSGVVSASIIFDSFSIYHMAEYDFYTGWMTFADFGGVIILVTIMHSVVMFFLSCCLEKNSKVLASVHKDSTYHSVGQEGF
jgi:hypothetical protein